MSWSPLRALATVVCSFALICGSAAAAQTPSADAKSDSKGDSKNALFKADRDFFAAVKARKLDGWMESMTDETTVFRDKPYSGLSAIRAAVATDFADPNFQLTWDPESAVILESGNMGYTSGHYMVVAEGADRMPHKSGGQYLTVWKKQKDGSWKVLWDGGASTGPIK
jgi:ketosteroid isomerase-like protein